MPEPSPTSWAETRREVGEMGIAVLSIDVIALCVGGLISRALGAEMWMLAAVVAAYVTLCFAVLISANIAVAYGLEWWASRCRSSSAAGS